MCLFCFKQKTAYEVRISDWSSDVCSSDLLLRSSFSSACFMESVLWAGEVHSADEHPRQPGDPRHKESGDDRPEEGAHDEAREWPPVADEVQHDRDQRRHDSQRVAHDAHDTKEVQHGSPLHHSLPKLDAHVAGLGEESHRLQATLASQPGLAHAAERRAQVAHQPAVDPRSEEHTSELQSLMRTS